MYRYINIYRKGNIVNFIRILNVGIYILQIIKIHIKNMVFQSVTHVWSKDLFNWVKDESQVINKYLAHYI